MGITDRIPDAPFGLAKRSVRTGEVAHIESQIELILSERLLHDEANLVQQELIAEPVLPRLNREWTGPARRAGISPLNPAERPDARPAQPVIEAEAVHQEPNVRDGRWPQADAVGGLKNVFSELGWQRFGLEPSSEVRGWRCFRGDGVRPEKVR